MLFTQDANEWLIQVDPWGDQEALNLLQAAQTGRRCGVFDCASTADGGRWFVMAPHAESVLVLPTADARVAFVAEVYTRFDLCRAMLKTETHFSWESARELLGSSDHDAEARAANESRPMTFQDRFAAAPR